MHEKFDYIDYARRVRQASKGLMGSLHSSAEISGRMHLLNLATERDLVRFRDAEQPNRVACGPGCGACCILNVSVLLPEAITIARYLKRHFSAEERKPLIDRLADLNRKTKWVDDEERLFMHEPCAFLDEQGSCMIHAVRPLLCRSITSTDPASCRESIAMAPLDGAPVIEMDLFHKKVFDTVYCELSNALEELGLDHRPRRLSASVLALMTDPEIVTVFTAGGKVQMN